jgi:hypothetical protein
MSAELSAEAAPPLSRHEVFSLREMLRGRVRDLIASGESLERFPLESAGAPAALLAGTGAAKLGPALREWGVRLAEPGASCALAIVDARAGEDGLPEGAAAADVVFMITGDRAASAAALEGAGRGRVSELQPPPDSDRSLISRELAVLSGEAGE